MKFQNYVGIRNYGITEFRDYGDSDYGDAITVTVH